YRFSNALVYLSDLKVSVEGKYVDSNPSAINVYLKGKDMDVQSVLSLLPEKYHKYISDYDSDGEFYCNAHINGKWGTINSPEMKADFGITKAEITQLSSGIVLKDVHVLGNYFSSSASSKTFLDLKTFSASLANGTIAGTIRIDNFSSPNVSASINATLLLEDVRHLLKIDSIWNYPIESLSGNLKVNMHYNGKLNHSGRDTKFYVPTMHLTGEMALENVGIKSIMSPLAFDSINGSFILNNNSVTINSFSGKTPKSDFYLKGILSDVLTYSFTDDADINVEATFHSNNFDLNEFLVNQHASSKRDTVYKISFSPRVNFILNSNIGHLTFRKFEAENIRGTFQLRNQKLIGDPISFSTMDGSVTAIGMIDNTIDSTLLITCNATLKKLNISKLFEQFEDFGQSTITHNHLKGIGTAEVQFASVWKSDLSVDMNRIYVRSNMTIEKGELLRFEPMKALSKYISVSELEDIKFSSLQNQIEIKDQKIFIPKMDIHSSALDVTIDGTHTFNNEIEYHFKVLMSDVLFQKARKSKKENNEFGVVEDDKSGKTSLFISMTGTVDNPIIKYDKQGAKQNLRENIAEEKQTLKQILKDEFKWFKKDTALNKKVQPKDDGKFIIKWEEDEKEKDKKEDDDF
ncbi:MAG: AsmA-like C-terminal region-containing protein, partial [Bacteroidota bacterium]